MNASALLMDLLHRGVRLWAAGEQLNIDAPKGVITPDLRAALIEHKADLLHLLNIDESEIAWRVEAMRGQYRPGAGFPFLMARRDFMDAPGHCLSCGEPHGPGRRFRCSPCVQAAEIVINEVMEGHMKNYASLHQRMDHGD